MVVPLIITLYNIIFSTAANISHQNAQLHLLQGNHYINVDVVLDSLHNFSLVGSGANNTSTVIELMLYIFLNSHNKLQ